MNQLIKEIQTAKKLGKLVTQEGCRVKFKESIKRLDDESQKQVYQLIRELFVPATAVGGMSIILKNNNS